MSYSRASRRIWLVSQKRNPLDEQHLPYVCNLSAEVLGTLSKQWDRPAPLFVERVLLYQKC